MDVFIAIIMLVFGIANVAAPEAMWDVFEGWKFKNAEPSDAALQMRRIGGIVTIVIAVIFLLLKL
jgi:hypothetical protein